MNNHSAGVTAVIADKDLVNPDSAPVWGLGLSEGQGRQVLFLPWKKTD